MDYFCLEAVFSASSPVSNNCFLYFLANNKNPYPLTCFPKLYWTNTASTTSRFGTFSPFFILSINCFGLPNNLIVSGVFNSELCPSFILNSNLLLILFM